MDSDGRAVNGFLSCSVDSDGKAANSFLSCSEDSDGKAANSFLSCSEENTGDMLQLLIFVGGICNYRVLHKVRKIRGGARRWQYWMIKYNMSIELIISN